MPQPNPGTLETTPSDRPILGRLNTDIIGTDGDDTLNGTGSPEQIKGLKGNDRLAGFGGDDTLFGAEGDDILDGGPDGLGHNTLLGGFGRDTYFVHSSDDVIVEAIETGVQDIVNSDAFFYKLPSGQQVEQLILNGIADGRAVTGQGNETGNYIQAINGKQHGVQVFDLDGYGGDDEIHGDISVPNHLTGGSGNDTLFGGTRGDEFIGVDRSGLGSDLGTNSLDVINLASGSIKPYTIVLGDERGSYYTGTGFARITGASAFSSDRLILAGSKADYTAAVFTDADGKGRTYEMSPNDRMTFFVSSDAIDFAENEVGYLACPPLHLHPHQAEIHYLVQGKLQYQIGEEIVNLESGEYLCIPANTPHAWINFHSEPARIVAVLTPGGSEAFFQTAASASLEPEAMMKLAQEYGTEILGAPLAASLAHPQ